MKYLLSKWIVALLITANIWIINIEYVEIKTEGECDYSAKIYLPRNALDRNRNDLFVFPVNSPYADNKLRREISESYYYDCFLDNWSQDKFPEKVSVDSIMLNTEYRFPCCEDVVLLHYKSFSPECSIWIVYFDSQNKWYSLISFCDENIKDHYNKMVSENPSILDMPVLCRAMMLLAIRDDVRGSEILKSAEEVLYAELGNGIDWWILYRYNIAENAAYSINPESHVFMNSPALPDSIKEKSKRRNEILYDGLKASGKIVKPPYVSHENGMDIVHLATYAHNLWSQNIRFWEISFDSKTGFLIAVKMVDEIE